MKKTGISLIFILCATVVFAQDIYKFRTTELAYQVYDSYNNQWSSWSDWQSTSVLVVIDLYKERITIYSSELQQYDVYEYYDEKVDSDGDSVSEFRAIDQDGIVCGIRFIRNTYTGRSQIYIDYSDMRWAYNVYSLD